MGLLKIVRYLSVLVAVVGAFMAIPEAALIMTLLGLVGGYLADEADKDNRMYFLVFAVALSTVSGAAGAIPEVGGYVSDIMGNFSTIINASALMIIIKAVFDRVTE